MLRPSFPSEEDLFMEYSHILEIMDDKPITIRLLDVGGDKFLPYYEHPVEKNPELGERSIRFLFRNEDILRTQLRALLRAATFGSPRIMIPFISSVSEVLRIRDIIIDEKQNLEREHKEFRKEYVPVGIMVELPAVVMNLEKVCKYVDFFSIGSNDLIQYTLGVDRENSLQNHYYDPSHPAIFSMFKKCIEVADKYNKDLSICGEMASEYKYIPVLVGMGFKNLSMNIINIKDAKRYIRQLTFAECSRLADEVLEEDTSEGINRILDEFLQKKGMI
jgi:phosphotransferase system enzyme I (PtsI)